MAFEIKELVNTVKKNPVPWAIGAGVAVIGGYFVFRQKPAGYVTKAYPEEPFLPEEIAAGDAKPGDISDAQLAELLAELERARHEDISQLAELNRQFMESLTKSLESYTSQQLTSVPQQPVQEPQLSQKLFGPIKKSNATPTILFSEKGTKYTPEQIDVMHSWAIEEQAAISRGTQTSKNPVGLAASGMTVTYHPTGHVAFVPKGQEAPPAPREYAPDPVSQAFKKASKREKIGWTSQQVSKVTGKTGTVEQQLAGMTQAEKLSALRKAGLIS